MHGQLWLSNFCFCFFTSARSDGVTRGGCGVLGHGYGVFFKILCLPKTLVEEVREISKISRAAVTADEEEGVSGGGYYRFRHRVFRVLTHRVVELFILNRSVLFCILSTLDFLGGMVTVVV